MTPEMISGWFDETDQGFYEMMVKEQLHHPGTFVEVGCWCGKSTAYLAGSILGRRRDIRLFAYDTFEGSANEPEMLKAASQSNVFYLFMENMRRCGFYFYAVGLGAEVPNGYPFVVRQMASLDAAKHHADKSLDFVFIDACHSYEAVTADIAAWREKVKPVRVLAGHDWNVYEAVRQAVSEAFGQVKGNIQLHGNCWYVRM